MTYQDVLESARQLSTVEKARLMAEISASLQQELRSSIQPKRSLKGIWTDVDISEQDIAQARDDMWRDFPREDIK